ncbi:MAG: hypothetical protein AAF721_07325 [Myxococcota bacterium]
MAADRGLVWTLCAAVACSTSDPEAQPDTPVATDTGSVAAESSGPPPDPASSDSGLVGSSGGSTGVADETSGEGDSSSSSGAAPEPTVTPLRITDTNRAHVDMHGGWGPHLRAPMHGPDGALWFAYDGGPGVLSNTTVHYAQLGADGWSTVASQPHGPGIQQNAAHVLRDASIVTYGIDTTGNRLEQCTFDTSALAGSCSTVDIGGPYSTPLNSNYVGAALGPANETVVWFTVVGAAGGQGQFLYTYDYGGGWNGPVVSALPGYNDMAYVRAHFRGPSLIDWVGQAYIGAYPNGSYAIGVGEVDFGQAAAFETLGPAPLAGEAVRNAGDVWIDPVNGDAHALARVDAEMHYYYLPNGSPWADALQPVQTIPGMVRARWLHEDGGPLVLVGSGGGVEVRWAEPGAAIDWTVAPSLPVEIEAEGLDNPTAIYASGPQYQTAAVTGLHFALCGAYGVSDHEIWHVSVEL